MTHSRRQRMTPRARIVISACCAPGAPHFRANRIDRASSRLHRTGGRDPGDADYSMLTGTLACRAKPQHVEPSRLDTAAGCGAARPAELAAAGAGQRRAGLAARAGLRRLAEAAGSAVAG